MNLKTIVAASLLPVSLAAAEPPPAFPPDPAQPLERTCFQTGQSWSPAGNLRADVAIVYGIDSALPERIETWRARGYRIHVMTGVSWGRYQDYLYGRFDGINHEDEAQTEKNGHKVSHGGDVYYMCPGTNYGKSSAAVWSAHWRLAPMQFTWKNLNSGFAAAIRKGSNANGGISTEKRGKLRTAQGTHNGTPRS